VECQNFGAIVEEKELGTVDGNQQRCTPSADQSFSVSETLQESGSVSGLKKAVTGSF